MTASLLNSPGIIIIIASFYISFNWRFFTYVRETLLLFLVVVAAAAAAAAVVVVVVV